VWLHTYLNYSNAHTYFRFGLVISKKFFTMRVMMCWHRLPRQVGDGSVQGQAGQGFEQPGLVEDVSAHGRGFGTR